MNKIRHIGALLTCGLAAAGMASVGLSSPAVASYGGPRPISNWLRPVEANTSTWVAIGWQSSSRICDVEIRVDGGRRVDVDYQGHRDYTTLSHGDWLGRYRADFSAVRVSPNFNRSGVAQLRTTIEYNDCDRHSRTERRSYWLALPVRGGHRWQGSNGGYDAQDHRSHSNKPTGHGAEPTSTSNGYGSRPNGHGAEPTSTSNGYGSRPNGHGAEPTSGPTPSPTVSPTDNPSKPGSDSHSGGGRPKV